MTDVLSTTTIPFLDLAPAHASVQARIVAEIDHLFESNAFTNGPQVQRFEQAFAAYCGTEFCVGVASGLDALRLSLVAMDVGPGDEVLVPANTFIATFEAVSQVGAIPVPVDVRWDDYNIDPDAAAGAVSERTRAILPVHLYGQLADMRGILAVAAASNLVVIEDACQAHGASREGLQPGMCSDSAAFSFYPGKNLGAIGDAGAVVTSNANVATAARSLREHGQRRKYHHELIGWTARLDTIQAIALLEKLPLLDSWNAQRAAVAERYSSSLAGVGDLSLPPVAPGSSPVWHLYVVRTADPEALALFLRERGIGTGRHYPEPAHLSAAYAHLGHARGEFPVTEQVAEEALSLPLYPGMEAVQVDAVVEAIRSYFGE